VEDVVAEGSA